MSTIVDDMTIQARLIEEKPAIDPADLRGAIRHLLETSSFQPPAQGSLL